MKKFIGIVIALVVLYIVGNYVFFHIGWYVDLTPSTEKTYFTKVEGKEFLLDKGDGFEPFEIRGVNMGSGIPGEWSTTFSIDKKTYLEWFGLIKDMGANTIRVYTVQNQDFYDALYEYNSGNDDPLYVLHGVWVNDYVQNSRLDAFSPEFMEEFAKDCQWMIDVIHGNKVISTDEMDSSGSGNYTHDVSQWVIGYILGVEWEDVTVAYTNEKYANDEEYNHYEGKYFYSAEDASPFEAMLAYVGDSTVEYESAKYGTMRPIAFSNWPTTDPFDYPADVTNYFMKCAKVDVDHIGVTADFIPGQFASYHIYPYYPDYLSYVEDWADLGITDAYEFFNEKGELNTYKAYLTLIANHHSVPVIVSEFGVSTGRGIAQMDQNTGRHQGHMSEDGQGQALVDCYHDIMDSGCAGCCVFTWQDEWFKRTWNTMYSVNLKGTPYWSDYQTNEQYFGLLSFDPGKETSICYVDGDVSEWTPGDVVLSSEGMELSAKYDEKYIYLRVHSDDGNLASKKIYIPVDTTQKSGSTYCENNGLLFERPADFLITIDGTDGSSIMVQERYEALRSNYSINVNGFDTYEKDSIPEKDSPLFVDIDMILQISLPVVIDPEAHAEVFNTGKLLYGNANPDSPDFDSLADYIFSGNEMELKLPWQILNFYDPSRMLIHDDYYDGHYGVSAMDISEINFGIGTDNTEGRIPFGALELKPWGNTVTYHERLKESYYALQEEWTGERKAPEIQPDGKSEIESVTLLGDYTALIKYTGAQNAESYNIYASPKANGSYELIGTSTDVAYYYETIEHQENLFYKVQPVFKSGEGTPSQAQKTGYNAMTVSSVPVFMYHEFLRPEDIADGVLFDEYAVWETEFEEDLKYLRDNGYTTISVQDMIDYIYDGKELPEKPVVLTIDDGKWGVYKVAWPLLKKYGMVANLSVIAADVDDATADPDKRHDRTAPYCTWAEIKEMSYSGNVVMMSHTYNKHHDMNLDGRISATMLETDTPGSYYSIARRDFGLMKYRMEKETGYFIPAMAYPHSRRTRDTDEVWIKAGYKLLFGGDREDLRRSNVNYFADGEGPDYYSTVLRRITRMTNVSIAEYFGDFY